jgi:hypothetical protein
MPVICLVMMCALAFIPRVELPRDATPVRTGADYVAPLAALGCPWYIPVCDDDGVHRG